MLSILSTLFFSTIFRHYQTFFYSESQAMRKMLSFAVESCRKRLAKNAVKNCCRILLQKNIGEKCCLKKLSKSVKFCRKMLQNLKKIVEFCSFLAKNDVKKSCRKLLSDYIVEKNCCRNLLSHYNSTLFLDGILRQILCRKMRSKKIVEPGQKILSKKAVAYCRKMLSKFTVEK